MRRHIALSLAVAFSCAFAQAHAQPMDDPMRPPAPSSAGVGAAASAPGRLQVVITSTGRKLAVIDGAVVPLGAAVGGAKLAGVSDSFAVLRKNGDRDVLLMHPNIDKKPAARRELP